MEEQTIIISKLNSSLGADTKYFLTFWKLSLHEEATLQFSWTCGLPSGLPRLQLEKQE